MARVATRVAAMASWDKVQVVFLIDVGISPPAEDLEHFSKSVYLACIRILLGLSSFPNKEHLKLQWSYKLFSSEKPFKTLGEKTFHFHHLRSEFLETFLRDLTSVISEGGSYGITSPRRCDQQLLISNWATSVYNILAGTVQDYAWDAPDIKSPRICPRTRQGKRNIHKPSLTASKVTKKSNNLIFMFSQVPQGVFTSNKGSATVDRILPMPLLSQLSCKNVCVHWVYQGQWMHQGQMMALEETLSSTGGSLLPISVLLPPTSNPSSNIILPFVCFLKDALECDGAQEQEHGRGENLWFCSKGEQINI